jgi:hypothetical protein
VGERVLMLLDTLKGYQELGIRWERVCYAPGHPAGISGARDQVGEEVLLLLNTLQGYQELVIRCFRRCSCSWTPCRDIRS